LINPAMANPNLSQHALNIAVPAACRVSAKLHFSPHLFYSTKSAVLFQLKNKKIYPFLLFAVIIYP